jgi:hypothetical protein
VLTAYTLVLTAYTFKKPRLPSKGRWNRLYVVGAVLLSPRNGLIAMRAILIVATSLSVLSGAAAADADSTSSVEPASSVTSNLPDSVVSDLQAKGFKVRITRPAQDTWVVDFSKEDKTKGQGLLRIGWPRQVSGKAIYVQSGSTWKAVDVDVKAEERPPLFGDWAPVEKDQEVKAVSEHLMLLHGPAN